MTSTIGKPFGAPGKANPSGSEPDWQAFTDGVRLIALRRLDDPALADDIAQEAVARAISRLATAGAEPIADLGGFIYGIARHLIADAHRTRHRTVPLESAGDPRDEKTDALDAAISREERTRVAAALRELAPADRDLLQLAFHDGLTAEEIGDRLHESGVNVRKRKSRALERLRRAFLGESHVAPQTD